MKKRRHIHGIELTARWGDSTVTINIVAGANASMKETTHMTINLKTFN